MNIHLFRGSRIGQRAAAQWCAAPIPMVSATFGGGGMYGEQGMLAAFGGGGLFRNEREENVLLGVWGARHCSRFRRLLREAGHLFEVSDLPVAMRLAIRWSRSIQIIPRG